MKLRRFVAIFLACLSLSLAHRSLAHTALFSSQEASSPPGPNIGEAGCPELVICIPPGSPCVNPITDDGVDFYPTCQPDGWVRAYQKCAWKSCGLLVCQCGPKQPAQYTCREPCN